MIGIVVAILGTCVLAYNKVFAAEVPVTVQIDQVDNSFLPNAEVRFHDVAVGTVDSATVEGDMATLNLAIDEAQISKIPKNVKVMILPKSLFGESFLSLVMDEQPAAERLAAGDVIPRDRSGKATAIEEVFDHLLPVIEAVKPADLANALGGLSTALTNRGQQLGDTTTQLHRYLQKFNPSLPDLTADIRALPPLTDTYSQAAPDLVQALKSANTTSKTLVDRKGDFADFYSDLTDASNDLEDFVDENGERIIDLARTARPVLGLLERYSPEYPCLFKRLAAAVPVAKKAFGEVGPGTIPALRVQVLITLGRGKFIPNRDEPEVTDSRGPRCYPDTPPIEQYPGGPAQDGSFHPPAAPPGSGTSQYYPFPTVIPSSSASLSAPEGPAVKAPAAPAKPGLPLMGKPGVNAGLPSGTPPILLRGIEGAGR
jgi:virulence factor Mce-like protein